MTGSLSRWLGFAISLMLAACTSDTGSPTSAVAIAAPAAGPAADETALPALFFALDRVGPFVIGTRYDSFDADMLEIGYSSESDEQATGQGCETFFVSGYEGLLLMFENGVLTRIDARRLFDDEAPRNFIATLSADTLPSGRAFAPIGQSIDAAETAFAGNLDVTLHPYLGEAGSYLEYFHESQPGYGLIMETEGDIIDSLRVGKADSVRYIEGCL